MAISPLPVVGDRVELVCDGVIRRAWVVPRRADGDVVQLAVAAPAGTTLALPAGCTVVYPNGSGAAWQAEVEVLSQDGTQLLVRLVGAERLQRRAHARLAVEWVASVAPFPDTPDTTDDRPETAGTSSTYGAPSPANDGAPGREVVRGHLRLVTVAPVAQRSVRPEVRWASATCLDLSAGGARLALGARFQGDVGQPVATRVAIPVIGNPVLPGHVVDVSSSRFGPEIVRVAFALTSVQLEDGSRRWVLREQLAERRRAHDC